MTILTKNKILVFEVDSFTEATVINRPSKIIKSPYLADILIDGKEYLAHSPSLGCCGLIVGGTKVLVTKKNNPNIKSKYSIDIILINNKKNIGVNPIYANYIVYNAINIGLIPELKNLESIKKEYVINKSRIDLFGIKNNKKYYIEVKNVPLADIVDVDKKERKFINNAEYNKNELIAIFPDGYRKNSKDPISTRAIKHIEELESLKLKDTTNQCFLIFIVQRSDCKYFTPSVIDQEYRNAVIKASKNGVNIKAYQMNWIDNKLFFDKELIVLL